MRSGDTVARLGGDEFVVVLENIANQAAAEGLLAVITEAVQVPVHGRGARGAADRQRRPRDGGTRHHAEALVRNADIAAYSAKRAVARASRSSPTRCATTALTKLSIEAELRTAIREWRARGALPARRGPRADATVVAFEALVRWQHPSRGLLHARQSSSTSAKRRTSWCRSAPSCSTRRAPFIAANPTLRGRVFVNVSTRQIGAADLPVVVEPRSRVGDRAADRLGLEITESGMLLATNAAHADLQRIKRHRRGPHHRRLRHRLLGTVVGAAEPRGRAQARARVHPSPGRPLHRRPHLTAMATLTHSLDMYGVIEGVETEAQFAIARQPRLDLGQGFLFGHPSAGRGHLRSRRTAPSP